MEEERRLSDRIWQASRGKADWVVVTDIDEHLFHPDMLGYLRRCQAEEVTAIRSLWYEMISDRFPDSDGRLIDEITQGCRSLGHSRLSIFNPNAVTATHFGPGRHQAWPEGHVVWPDSEEVLLLHYKQLGIDYVAKRSAELSEGMRTGDLERGWGSHYRWTPDEIAGNWQTMRERAVTVPGLGTLREVSPDDFRGDEKIVERSGLLDPDWYLATYPDVLADRAEPLTHFCLYGWREGRMPNFYFDTSWYAQAYASELAEGVNPLVHYITRGERAGARPSRHFDAAWYRAQHDLAPDESPLRHFLLRRTGGQVSPLPDFDARDYCRRHPEVAREGRDPFEDYAEQGNMPLFGEGRPAYPTFELVAQRLGIDAWDPARPATIAWGEFVDVIRMFLPLMPFNEAWYLENNPDVAEAVRAGDMRSGREHFAEHGYFEGRLPSPPEDGPDSGGASSH